MITRQNPGSVAAPLGAYSHVVSVPPSATWHYFAGQVGIMPDGTIPDDAAGQCEQAYRNVLALVEAVGLTAENLVGLTIYLTSPDHLATARDSRGRVLGDLRPASTLVYVSGLADPKLVIEVQAVAAG